MSGVVASPVTALDEPTRPDEDAPTGEGEGTPERDSVSDAEQAKENEDRALEDGRESPG